MICTNEWRHGMYVLMFDIRTIGYIRTGSKMEEITPSDSNYFVKKAN